MLPGKRNVKRCGRLQVKDGRQVKAVDVKLLKTDSMSPSRAKTTPPSGIPITGSVVMTQSRYVP